MRKKTKKYIPSTWYLVNGMIVEKVRTGGAKYLEYSGSNQIVWKPIYADKKRNVVIAIREA